jgi:hypothetical protein
MYFIREGVKFFLLMLPKDESLNCFGKTIFIKFSINEYLCLYDLVRLVPSKPKAFLIPLFATFIQEKNLEQK